MTRLVVKEGEQWHALPLTAGDLIHEPCRLAKDAQPAPHRRISLAGGPSLSWSSSAKPEPRIAHSRAFQGAFLFVSDSPFVFRGLGETAARTL